jgi:hypothetical protein
MASCWICLDDGADQYGKSPVRDCSYRGMMLASPTFRALLSTLEGKASTGKASMRRMISLFRGSTALLASNAINISYRSIYLTNSNCL